MEVQPDQRIDIEPSEPDDEKLGEAQWAKRRQVQTIVAKYLDTVRYVATIGARMSLEWEH